LERLATRAGFLEPYYKVTFDLISEGIPTSQIVVWVHPAYPEDTLICVAQTFAWSRLVGLAEAANKGVLSEEEVQDLWQRVKPVGFTAV
jgi:hypothetical protein